MKAINIKYMDVKERQNADVQRKRTDPRWTKDLYNFYRKFSTPFTYLFVRIGISSSTISILNFFPCIIGFLLLSAGTYFFMIAGLLFFMLFKTLDCSDGEVARIQNPDASNPLKKVMEGPYFDGVGHFIEPICLGAGLGIGLYHLYGMEIYLTLGALLAIILTLEFALNELVRSYFRRGIIERKIKLKKDLKHVQKELMERIGGSSWPKRNVFLKIFSIYPQGLFYSREFFDPILIILIIIELLGFGSIMGITILPSYILVTGAVKLVKIVALIAKLNGKRLITATLNELQSQ